MKKNLKFVAFAILATVAFISCNDEPNTGGGDDPQAETLKGDITEDLTLVANTTYELTGELYVKDGATLYIEEGVTIIAQDVEDCPFILIEQGAKIEAVGTASNPIVMTSAVDKAGAWGGIHICGYAPINKSIPASSEVGLKPYGGTDAADNSGTLKYVRVENSGFSYSADQECNGITFYGVGNGTTVSYVQTFRGTDDGLEFFGGTVNVDHIVVTSVSDDSYDWTDGWVGCGQFLVAYQEPKVEGSSVDYDCDCLLECDNNSDNPTASPMSNPTLANLTLIGNNSSSKKNGVNLKAGSAINIYNAIITGKDAAFSFKKDDVAVTNYTSGTSVISGVEMDNSEVYVTYSETVDGVSSTIWAGYSELTNLFVSDSSNGIDVDFTPTNYYVGIITEGAVSVPAVANSNFTFETANYKGAVDPSNDWTLGWTRTPESESTVTVAGELVGNLTEDMTLKAFSTYHLTGELYIKAGATLYIEEGVEIIAQDVDDCPFILVEQGAKIEAVGTASNPIVMTSAVDKAGAWGGIHICGYAPINKSIPASSEVGLKPYGGTDASDNSGTLKYVRVENTGFAYSADQECNGISFYGVGNGTTVSYVQAYHGTDDGLEFFGGTVNIDHIVVTSVSDDSYDWTDGWVGCGQFLVAYQDAKVEGSKVDYDCDCLLECDNNSDSPNADPMSNPTLANLTLIGNSSSSKKNGVNLKAGSAITLYNTIIAGKDAAFSFKKDDVAVTNYTSGVSVIEGVNIDNSDIYVTYSETVDGVSSTKWAADATLTSLFTSVSANLVSQSFTPDNKYAGIVDGGVSLPAVANSNFSFEATSYKGAVDPSNDWTAGWTRQ